MRAVARLFAFGRDGLPDACSPPTSSCAGLAFLPWGFPPWAGAALFCFFSLFSSAISCFTFLTVSDVAPVREELNLVASGQWLVARNNLPRTPPLKISHLAPTYYLPNIYAALISH